MMRKPTHILLVLAAILLSACSGRENTSREYGYLKLKLSEDLSVETLTKSAGAADPLFRLEVTSAQSGEVTLVPDYRALETEPLTLIAGRYDIKAFSGENAPAVWNSPFYTGETSVTVKPEQTTTASISASLASSMVTVGFGEEIPSNFSSYKVSISSSLGGETLVFGNEEKTLLDTAYFAAGADLTWKLDMINNDGTSYSAGPDVIKGIEAKKHYRLTFNVSEDEKSYGGFVVRMSLDDSLNEKKYSMYLNFGSDENPRISANFDFSEAVVISQGNEDTRIISLAAGSGIGSASIRHANAGLLEAGLPQAFEFVEASSTESLSKIGIEASPIAFGALTASIDMTKFISSLKMGDYPFTVSLIDAKNHYSTVDILLRIVSSVEAEVTSVTPWAKFAILKGKWYSETAPAGLKFQYRKSGEEAWTDYTGEMKTDGRDFSTELYGLEASATYQVRAVTDKDTETRVISFTTGSAEDVHNLSFDNWYQSGKVWYPNASGYSVWDSANPGTGSLLGVNSTVPEESDLAVSGSGKKAAKLESTTAVGQFVAGNIYVGKFGGVAGLGAYLDWGHPFTSRPIALKGYFKYIPATINKTKDPYTDMSGQMDNCSIKIYLTDWTTMFRVNTSTGTFLSDDDPSIIAIGDLHTNETTDGYVQFTLPLQYRNTGKTPSMILIAATASRLGDYFTGGVGSVLLLDEFSLVYDAGELTESERETVGYRN